MFSEAFESFLKNHVSLVSDAIERNQEAWRIPIRLPLLQPGRGFSAWLILPKHFQTTAKARIQLSKDAVLRIPHVEFDGNLCIDGEPGPGTPYTDEERIDSLLNNFYTSFLDRWDHGELDGDFEKEAVNYWRILVAQRITRQNPIERIFTVDARAKEARVYKARLLQPSRVVVAGENDVLADRLIASFGYRSNSTQIINVLVADIPIEIPLSPDNWPKREGDLLQLLESRLTIQQRNLFLQNKQRGNSIHRLAILRAHGCSFGYLLSGGPPTVVRKALSTRAYPCSKLLPLFVERLDPSWSYGRDQNPQIQERQQRSVVVFGAGALGSSVIDQLAKAGIGSIAIVDNDVMSSANIGRHLLGAESIRRNKAEQIAERLSRANPSVALKAYTKSAEVWLAQESLEGIDLILDLTGEPDVRVHTEIARQAHPCPLLVGWMEPFVAAAHACTLLGSDSWFRTKTDPLDELQAVCWPADIMQREPSCTSNFQSYTASAAAYAISLVAETAIALLDGDVHESSIRSWVRGQAFLDRQYSGLVLRDWALDAANLDGVLLNRPWNE